MCMQEGRILKEWRMGLIVPKWKRKGDVHDPGKYRGITLLIQVLKLLERVRGGERNSRRDARPAIDGREDTGGTGQYGHWIR